jgi:hypothetical protein
LFTADLADREQTIRAVSGSTVVHLLAGLRYNLGVWQEFWPQIMANTIEACKRAEAKLIFFDNVYMYGKVAGPMTENKIATALMNEVQAGGLSATARRTTRTCCTPLICARRRG